MGLIGNGDRWESVLAQAHNFCYRRTFGKYSFESLRLLPRPPLNNPPGSGLAGELANKLGRSQLAHSPRPCQTAAQNASHVPILCFHRKWRGSKIDLHYALTAWTSYHSLVGLQGKFASWPNSKTSIRPENLLRERLSYTHGRQP